MLLKSPRTRFLLVFAAFAIGYYLYSLAFHRYFGGRISSFWPHPFIRIGSMVALLIFTRRIYGKQFAQAKTS